MKAQDSKTYTGVDGQPYDILADWYPLEVGQIVVFNDFGCKCIGRVINKDIGKLEVWKERLNLWCECYYTTRRARLAFQADLNNCNIPLKDLPEPLRTEVENYRAFRLLYL